MKDESEFASKKVDTFICPGYGARFRRRQA